MSGERWKPKVGKSYWTVNLSLWYGYVLNHSWCENFIDNRILKLGNIFRTKREAMSALKRVKAALMTPARHGGDGA